MEEEEGFFPPTIVRVPPSIGALLSKGPPPKYAHFHECDCPRRNRAGILFSVSISFTGRKSGTNVPPEQLSHKREARSDYLKEVCFVIVLLWAAAGG